MVESRSVGKLAFGTPHKGLVYLTPTLSFPPESPSHFLQWVLSSLLLTRIYSAAHIPQSPWAKIVNNADYVKRLYVITVIAITMLYESPVGARKPPFRATHAVTYVAPVFLLAFRSVPRNPLK